MESNRDDNFNIVTLIIQFKKLIIKISNENSVSETVMGILQLRKCVPHSFSERDTSLVLKTIDGTS